MLFSLEDFQAYARCIDYIERGMGFALEPGEYQGYKERYQTETRTAPLSIFLMYSEVLESDNQELAFNVMVKSKEYRLWLACKGVDV